MDIIKAYTVLIKFTPLLVNTGNRLVNFWQKFGKQWELESVLRIRIKRTVECLYSIILLSYMYM